MNWSRVKTDRYDEMAQIGPLTSRACLRKHEQRERQQCDPRLPWPSGTTELPWSVRMWGWASRLFLIMPLITIIGVCYIAPCALASHGCDEDGDDRFLTGGTTIVGVVASLVLSWRATKLYMSAETSRAVVPRWWILATWQLNSNCLTSCNENVFLFFNTSIWVLPFRLR